MSRAIAAARPSTESAVAAGQLPTRQSRKPRRPKLIDAPRQSKPCQHVDQRQLSLRSAASSHPDCRAVLIQIVAQYPSGIRHGGGAKLNQALVWNVRTWPAMPREKAQAAPTVRLKVPMRRRGADCLVVATKWGNAHGAKGVGHRR